MIGDEISDRLLTFGVRSGTHTMSRAIGFGVRAILNKLRENEASRAGEMPLEKLSQGQQAAIQGIEVSPQRISEFDHFAKKYGLQYSVIQEENDPTKLFITFRQKDIEKLDMAVTDMMKDRTRECDEKEIDKMRCSGSPYFRIAFWYLRIHPDKLSTESVFSDDRLVLLRLRSFFGPFAVSSAAGFRGH